MHCAREISWVSWRPASSATAQRRDEYSSVERRPNRPVLLKGEVHWPLEGDHSAFVPAGLDHTDFSSA